MILTIKKLYDETYLIVSILWVSFEDLPGKNGKKSSFPHRPGNYLNS